MDVAELAIVVGVSGGTFILGLIAYLNNRSKLANGLFAVMCGLSGLYIIVNYLSDHDQSHALLWSRLTFVLATLILPAVIGFINVFPRRILAVRYVRPVAYLASVVVLATLLPGFITGVKLSPGHTDIVTGSLYFVFIVYVIVLVVLGGWLFVRGYRGASRGDRQKLQYVFAGLGLTTLFLLATNFILPLITGTNRFSAFGSYFFVIFTSFCSYAIIRHRLFDVKLLVARSVTYLLLLITLGALYVGAAFSVSELFFGDAARSWGQTVVYAGLSLVLAFMFQPLRRTFEHITDRIFYRDRYNAREVLDAISRILVSEMDIDRLLSRSLDTLCRELRIQFGQLVIFNDDHVYRVGHFGPLPKRLLVAPELRRFGTGMVVADELASGERKELLESHGLQVSLGLKTGKEFVGYLLIGDKLSGDSYSKSDLQLIALLGKELAVGIANAKSYAEIQAFNLTLQDKVNHATSRLRVANRHLKELDKTKDEFLSMASHQLRTPLTTIKGYLSMMSEGDAGRLTATQREFVGYAFDASERMVNLISDLLNVSRLEAGRFLIQPTPIDLSAMVADEVRQLQSHAANKHLALTYIGPTEAMPPVNLDENKTRQVIMNFIDNAIYYTREGGITVTLGRHDTIVRLEVTDTGIGVPEAAKKKLFTKFYRADNAQGVRPDGTGLGLYLARRVVVDQGGTIIFKSTEGHGSTFGFELPLVSSKQKVAT